MRLLTTLTLTLGAAGTGCGGEHAAPAPAASLAIGRTLAVRETTITTTFDAAGVAEPVERAVLGTKLMGSVVAVLVREGDRVHQGQRLARIDARDLEAKRSQVDAGVVAAEAAFRDAETQAGRFRALLADSAATPYQLDQVETALARASAGLDAARAARAEVQAIDAYAEILAPFAGVITARHVDPGAFVAPGTPILEVQSDHRLRISVAAPPLVAMYLRRGQRLGATIEGREVPATIEGTVPAAGAIYTVNAIVPNSGREFLPGSAATLRIPDGRRTAILVPSTALIREGDLVGVRVVSGGRSVPRWVRVSTEYSVPSAQDSGLVEVLSGLRPGDVIQVGGD